MVAVQVVCLLAVFPAVLANALPPSASGYKRAVPYEPPKDHLNLTNHASDLEPEGCPSGLVPQHDGTVCCVPVYCTTGHSIEACSSDGGGDRCRPCPPGMVQTNNVTSFNMDEAVCYPEDKNGRQNCPVDDTKKSRTYWNHSCFLHCECKNEECYYGDDPCMCNLAMETCGVNYEMDRSTGYCVPCAWHSYKPYSGCGPCILNVTLYRLGKQAYIPLSLSTTAVAMEASSNSDQGHTKMVTNISPVLENMKETSNADLPIWAIALIIILSILVAVGLGIAVGFLLYKYCYKPKASYTPVNNQNSQPPTPVTVASPQTGDGDSEVAGSNSINMENQQHTVANGRPCLQVNLVRPGTSEAGSQFENRLVNNPDNVEQTYVDNLNSDETGRLFYEIEKPSAPDARTEESIPLLRSDQKQDESSDKSHKNVVSFHGNQFTNCGIYLHQKHVNDNRSGPMSEISGTVSLASERSIPEHGSANDLNRQTIVDFNIESKAIEDECVDIATGTHVKYRPERQTNYRSEGIYRPEVKYRSEGIYRPEGNYRPESNYNADGVENSDTVLDDRRAKKTLCSKLSDPDNNRVESTDGFTVREVVTCYDRQPSQDNQVENNEGSDEETKYSSKASAENKPKLDFGKGVFDKTVAKSCDSLFSKSVNKSDVTGYPPERFGSGQDNAEAWEQSAPDMTGDRPAMFSPGEAGIQPCSKSVTQSASDQTGYRPVRLDCGLPAAETGNQSDEAAGRGSPEIKAKPVCLVSPMPRENRPPDFGPSDVAVRSEFQHMGHSSLDTPDGIPLNQAQEYTDELLSNAYAFLHVDPSSEPSDIANQDDLTSVSSGSNRHMGPLQSPLHCLECGSSDGSHYPPLVSVSGDRGMHDMMPPVTRGTCSMNGPCRHNMSSPNFTRMGPDGNSFSQPATGDVTTPKKAVYSSEQTDLKSVVPSEYVCPESGKILKNKPEDYYDALEDEVKDLDKDKKGADFVPLRVFNEAEEEMENNPNEPPIGSKMTDKLNHDSDTENETADENAAMKLASEGTHTKHSSTYDNIGMKSSLRGGTGTNFEICTTENIAEEIDTEYNSTVDNVAMKRCSEAESNSETDIADSIKHAIDNELNSGNTTAIDKVKDNADTDDDDENGERGGNNKDGEGEVDELDNARECVEVNDEIEEMEESEDSENSVLSPDANGSLSR